MTQLRITPLNRPVEDFGRWRTEITPEMQAESMAYQKQREALRQQFESEWERPVGYSRERELEGFENIECAAFDVWEERREGRTAAASTPVWIDAFEYWLINGPTMEDTGVLAKAPTAASLTLPITLKGGGDMQVTFETKKVLDTKSYGPEPRTWMRSKFSLTVRTEHGVFMGWLKGGLSERHWYVISLPSKAPQEVADRIATTLDAIQKLKLAEDYLTIMPVSDRCSICARPLKDITSKTLGIGPDCAAQLGVKHSASVADAIVARRRAFLAEEIAA